jgi:dihydrofolate synthase/folylpolyglutamate synthase
MPTAVAPIAGALADLEERVSRPLVLVVGMLSTKDSGRFLAQFLRLARRVITVPIHQDKAVPAEALAEHRADHRHSGDRPRHCRERARRSPASSISHPAPRVLITGSLYLAGEVLAANGTPPE